jgi:hypothetical protein
VFVFVAGWTIALGALFMALVCAMNCLGLARGWLRTGAGMSVNLGLGMISAGLSGSVWALPTGDAALEPWRDYWMVLAAAGMVVFVSSDVRRAGEALWLRVRQGARIYTIRREWRRKHFVLLGMVAAAFFLPGFLPNDDWQFWAAFIPFLILSDRLKTLPIHFGRRPPTPLGTTGL